MTYLFSFRAAPSAQVEHIIQVSGHSIEDAVETFHVKVYRRFPNYLLVGIERGSLQNSEGGPVPMLRMDRVEGGNQLHGRRA